MLRRVLHVLALAMLVLASPARGFFAAGPDPQGCCCCGETEGPSPCGMPKAPCAPRCPQTGASQGLLAPVVASARAQALQAEETAPRKEPAPWPATLQARSPRPALLVLAPSHGPPLWSFGDPQAGLATFRI